MNDIAEANTVIEARQIAEANRLADARNDAIMDLADEVIATSRQMSRVQHRIRRLWAPAKQQRRSALYSWGRFLIAQYNAKSDELHRLLATPRQLADRNGADLPGGAR